MSTISQGTEIEKADAEKATSDVVEPLWKKVLNDRFTILEPIGSGGMGKVYKAIQSPLDRVVAIKILKNAPNLDPGFRQRFFLEASHTSKLRHPNTVTVIDYGETADGIFYLAMEYLDGQPLAQILAESGPLHWTRCLHIAQQVCRSLREAHKLGIVHRDLKPSNVMLLTEDGDQDLVKVLDFGLVKSFVREGAVPEAEITNPGIFLGSPQYMAPEQLRGQADPRSDIYSLGVMLYQMLVGKPPFVASDAIDVMFQHMNEPPVPVRKVRPDLPISDEIEMLVMKCLAKKPDQRFQSMEELLEALRQVVAAAGGAAELALAAADTGAHRRPPERAQAVATPAAEQTLAIDIDVLAPPPLPPIAPLKRTRKSFRFAENYPVVMSAVVAFVLVLAATIVIVHHRARGKEQTASMAVKSPVAARRLEQPTLSQPAPAEPRPNNTPVEFRIRTDPPGARVHLNGKAIGQTPLVMNIAPGADGNASAEFTFKLDGYQPLTVITGGQPGPVVVNERLEPAVGPRAVMLRRQRENATEAESDARAPSNEEKRERSGAREAEPKLDVQPKVVTGDFLGSVPASRPELGTPPPGGGGGAPGLGRPQLDESTVRLTKISGPDPQYTPQALDREVEGVMSIKCEVSKEGAVRNCRVIKGLPYMDRAVVMALEGRRYQPHLVNGQPVEIDYTFHLRLKLPR